MKKRFLKNLAKNLTKFTRKRLCWSLFFNKVAGLRSATLLKKRLQHICFPVNFAKLLGTLFLQNTWCGCFCTLKRPECQDHEYF